MCYNIVDTYTLIFAIKIYKKRGKENEPFPKVIY